jgi:hypothetical protein
MKRLKTIPPVAEKYQVVFITHDGEMHYKNFSVNENALHLRHCKVVDERVLQSMQMAIRGSSPEVGIDAARMVNGLITFKKDGEYIGVSDGSELLSEWIVNHPPLRYLRLFGQQGVSHPGRKRRYGRTLRSMRTHSTLRAAGAVLKSDGEPDFRGRQRTLPTAWDDYKIGSIEDRSWKKYRKTRWKIRK